jgi:hypothetical protein
MDNKTTETKEAVSSENKKTCCEDLKHRMAGCCGKFGHKKIVLATVIVGLLLLMLISFAVGVSVGFHKAKFSSRFGENYERNFMGQHFGVGKQEVGLMGKMKEKMGEFEGRGMRNGHGVAGTIISISDGSIVVKDKDNKEITISVSDQTIINQGQNTIKIGDLKNDEQIIVIGKPGDNGVINADLIRVFDNNITNN